MSDREPTGLAGLLGRVAQVEPREAPAVVAAFVLFFCVLGGYFAVRPVRETVGTMLGKDRVTDLYTVTWIASIIIVPLYGLLCARFRRSKFLPWIYGFVALSLAGVGFALSSDEHNIAVGQFFYVWISVLNLFIVSVFWSFLLELFDADQTHRLFGVIAAGGTTGALVGPLLTDLTVSSIGNSGVLYHGCRVLYRGDPLPAPAARESGRVRRSVPALREARSGRWVAIRSPDSRWCSSRLTCSESSLFVILLASVNTFLYFEQLRLVTETFPDVEERTRVFSRLDYIVQGLAVRIAAFHHGTGRLQARCGGAADSDPRSPWWPDSRRWR